MKKQVLFIGGASAYDTYEDFLIGINNVVIDLERSKTVRWNYKLPERLGDEYEVIKLDMPNRDFADYDVWKIWLEKYLPLLNNNLILIGHSMGGIFLAKYLSENKTDKDIEGLFLVAPPAIDSKGSLGKFKLDLKVLPRLSEGVEKIHLYFSTDDHIVSIDELEHYKKALPYAYVHIYGDKGHFSLLEFPELIEDIKNI